MPIFEVTEIQTIAYRWRVEADTEREAEASDLNGVPDAAISKLIGSETRAERVDATVVPDVVLDRYVVRYRIVTGIDGSVIGRAKVVVRALDKDAAANVARDVVDMTDARVDPRVQATIVIESAQLIKD